MPKPQQPELARSGRSDVDPNSDATKASVRHVAPAVEGETGGHVPEANRPGHQDESPPDQPDLDAFAEKLGVKPKEARTRADAALAVGAALAIPPLRLGAKGLDALIRRLEAQGGSGPAEREAQGPSGPAEREAQGPSGPAEREK